MPGIKIYKGYKAYFAETLGEHPALAKTFKVGYDCEQATRNAVQHFSAIEYLTGDGVDAKVAAELGIPVR